MNSFELVIFDCDGVLVDSETITNALMVDMLKPFGVVFNRQEYINRYVGIKLEDCIDQISELFDVNFPSSFISDYHQIALELLDQNVKAIEGVQNLIERLTVPFCLASNSHEAKVKLMLERTDLLPFFKGKIFSSTSVSKPKPAPDVYLLAARTMGIKPEECAVIEDTPVGIRAGKAAGMTVYGYEGLFSGSLLLDAGADVVFDHMDQLFLKP